jgi:hypothetical protein
MIRLASSPEPHTVKPERTALDMFKAQNGVGHAHRNIPEQGPEPKPGPNPEPDAAISDEPSSIAPEDWGALFKAVTERLEACSGHASLDEIPELGAEHHNGNTPDFQVSVRDCVDAMNLLRAALPGEWHPRKRVG